jgi:hypothetical protein
VSPDTPASGRRDLPAQPVTRRGLAAFGLASVAVLAGGCTREDRRALPKQPKAAPDPDTRLVSRALTAEKAVVALLVATAHRHAVLRPALRQPLRIHRAHVDLLAGASSSSSSSAGSAPRTPRVPSRQSAAVAALVDAERALHAAHVETAVKAESGVLARVVAGMAAASAQQQLVLSDLGTIGSL